jgi:hypothetical protein
VTSKKQSTAESLIASTLQGHKAQAESGRLRVQNKALLSKLAVAEERAGIAEALKAGARVPKPIKAKKLEQLHKRVATPVFMCSDWHVEETVHAKTVNGLNSYSLAEADARIERLGDAMCWMIEHHRASFEIRECVLWLGGDLMTGYIHDELKENNALSPVETVLWLQTRIERLIAKLLSVSGIESVTVVTSHGNHGRTTLKTQISSGAANSYEWLLYHTLRRTFEANNRVQFHVADGEFTYLDVNGVTVRFTHGDAAAYGGGIGGLTIPLNKAIARWQTHKHAAITCLGHFHQLYDLPGFVVNGSLIGTSPYGLRVGGFEVPAQASFLIDAKRKVKCMSTTLWPVGSDHGKGK